MRIPIAIPIGVASANTIRSLYSNSLVRSFILTSAIPIAMASGILWTNIAKNICKVFDISSYSPRAMPSNTLCTVKAANSIYGLTILCISYFSFRRLVFSSGVGIDSFKLASSFSFIAFLLFVASDDNYTPCRSGSFCSPNSGENSLFELS